MTKPSKQRCFDLLGDLLGEQKKQVDELISYLAELKSAISDGDSEQLMQLVGEQHIPSEKIEFLDQQRAKLLKDFGFESTTKGLLGCIGWCDQQDQLEQQFEQLRQTLQQLQVSVQTNHQLVSKSRKRIRQSLHLLTGQISPNKTSTYSAAGIEEEIANKRTLAQA